LSSPVVGREKASRRKTKEKERKKERKKGKKRDETEGFIGRQGANSPVGGRKEHVVCNQTRKQHRQGTPMPAITAQRELEETRFFSSMGLEA